MEALSFTGKKTLLILPEDNQNIFLSGRNVPKAQIGTAGQVNTYDLVNATQLIIVESALTTIESYFSN
jgi:large subunit ribosomal protein L4